MRKLKTGLLMILLAAPLAAGQAPADAPELGEPVRLGFAGVKISIPKGFRLLLSDDANLVLHARKVENNLPVQGLKLMAYPIPKAMATADFIRAAHPGLGQAFRKVTVHKEKPVQVCGAQGAVHVMSYEYRGKPLMGIWMFFLRPVADGNFQMGYVLSVEADKSRGQETLPALIAVAGSIELFDPVRPITEKIALTEEPILSRRFGFAIRPPAWWKVNISRTPTFAGVNMFQTDYLFMGLTLPVAVFSAQPSQQKPSDCAQKEIDRIAGYLKIKKIEYEVIQKGPAAMGGQEGYEIIISHATPAVGDWPKKRMCVVRTVCAAGITYSLKLEYDTEEKGQLLAAMDAIAAGLELTAPTEATTASAPAATAPATRPAPKPPTATGQDQNNAPGEER